MTNVNEVEEAMGMASHHQALATQHQRKAQQFLEQAISLAGGGVSAKIGANQNGPNCLRVWARYLSENGPSLRQEIQDETGTKFTERATPYTIMWDDGMAAYSDDHFAADTIVRMRSVRNADGRAGTQTAYFLWCQRFDVYPRFGVGPRGQIAPALLGVIHPPVTADTVPLEHQEIRNPQPEVEATYIRYPTMDDWYAQWVPFCEQLAKYDAVPTAEEKEEMLGTLPEDTDGEPAGTILARTYAEAKERTR